MFFGTYQNQLDDKNRMRVPAKLRAKLGEGYTLVYGAGGCLFVMPEEAFQKILLPLTKIPLSDLEAQEHARRILSTVEQPEEDGQGRFVLPAHAKAYAGIDKKIVFLGVGERIEIWSEEKFTGKNMGDQQGFDNAVSQLARYGL